MIACVNVQKWKILCIAIEISHPFSCRFWKLTHKKASNRLILCAAIFSIRNVFFFIINRLNEDENFVKTTRYCHSIFPDDEL